MNPYHRRTLTLLAPLLLAACATGRPQLPYPVFVQADELPDVFVAALPGVRGKQFAGNPQTRRSSNRIVLPANWSGTTGGSPDKSLELFVLYGEMRLGDLPLSPGGYAWLPPGHPGINISSSYGAEILYFLDDANPATQIRTPIIYSANVVNWQPAEDFDGAAGLEAKVLRRDPGSGARTWLLKVTPQARFDWLSRARTLEGYLVSGRYRGVECHAGKPVSAEYTEGGYFHRPPDTVHGGPREQALETSTWFMRQLGPGDPMTVGSCPPPPTD